jgi:release factor glutamine methyltransferase
VIEPFLDAAGRVLAPDGRVLLLVSSLTGFADVVEYAVARGFDAETVREASYPYETLSVLRLDPR